MGGLNKAQFEKLAEGVADGLTVKDAALAAGYGRDSTSYYQVVKRQDFKDRLAVLRDERPWCASRDAGPVILELRRCAEKAFEGKSAAALNAARGLLMAVAELKQQLPEPRSAGNDATRALLEWHDRHMRDA